jgi:hypothetical protein
MSDDTKKLIEEAEERVKQSTSFGQWFNPYGRTYPETKVEHLTLCSEPSAFVPVRVLSGLLAAVAAADAENEKLRAALTFYADPFTYEQVDILGKCGLSDDGNEDEDGRNPLYGRRARAALAPKAAP